MYCAEIYCWLFLTVQYWKTNPHCLHVLLYKTDFGQLFHVLASKFQCSQVRVSMPLTRISVSHHKWGSSLRSPTRIQYFHYFQKWRNIWITKLSQIKKYELFIMDIKDIDKNLLKEPFIDGEFYQNLLNNNCLHTWSMD